jgi:hypothetical protein
MSSTITPNVILNNPYIYYTWFVKIQGSVLQDLWVYFNPESEDKLAPLKITIFNEIKDGVILLQGLTQAEKTIYTQLRTIYNHNLTQYHRLLNKEVKL